MELIKNLIDYISHLDKHINLIIQNFGIGAYFLFFAIIFAETGFVVTPFLPGDSFLFTLGAFAAVDSLNVVWLAVSLAFAAILGDSLNYTVGKYIGAKLLAKGDFGLIKKEYIERTNRFYEKYGPKTIVLARFVPIVRTFAPFVAGVGKMSYPKFFAYNVAGGILWINLFIFGGFFFGNIKVVKEHFSITILVIIFLSILPGIIEVWKHKRQHHAYQAVRKE